MEEITEDQKIQIGILAGKFYLPQQIAVMLEMDTKNFLIELQMESSCIYKAYWKGFYEAEMKFRDAVIKLANFGSSPAQTMVAQMIEKLKIDSVR